jgi:hypothetical protein
MTISQISEKIELLLNDIIGTQYFTVEDCNGNNVKIRVSDHSANYHNNGEAKTLSFVASRTKQRKSAFNQMINEWAYIGDGLVDTYESIEDIIESELNN